jgi:predicted TPR repeat methyltransferase/predicted negative regulator of RcsB-dependent stress response
MGDSQNLDKLLIEAQLSLQDNKIDSAIQSLQEILSLNPNSVDALRYLALAYVQQKQYQEAIASFELAISLDNNPILNMNLANVYKLLNNHAAAIKYYEFAIQINPKYAKAHNNLAGLYTEINEYNKALYHYKEALHADPSFTLAHLNLGILLFKNQEIEPAITQFNNVLAIDERNLTAFFYLGLINLAQENLPKSLEFFQEVLQINPEHVESLVNIGVILLKQNKAQLAIDYFTRALALDENNLEARNNLAATFIHNDRYENALKYYFELLKEDPKNLEYLYNTGVAQMGLGRIDDAINMFRQVLSIDNKHFGALSNLAAIKMRNRDKNGALELLHKALAVEPNNKTTKFMLKALSDEPVETCKEYAADLFNHYALYYDKHMQETLKYKLPRKLWEILHNLNLNNSDIKFQKTLDLGCGTGLCGDILKSFSQYLIGVDISEKMLAIAATKEVYEQLISRDILEFLQEDKNKYDLIVCLDVLPYFGSLNKFFNYIIERLSNNGILIFSTEISENSDWQIQESMRFKHSPQYILNLCKKNNLLLKYKDRVRARKQDNIDLEEMVYVCFRV